VVPWGKRHEQDAETQDEGRNELKSKGNLPCSLFLCHSGPTDLDIRGSTFVVDRGRHKAYIVGAEVDPKADHDTECDRLEMSDMSVQQQEKEIWTHQLLQSNKTASHFGRRHFSIVKRNGHAQGANTEASNETAAVYRG
jgi:hypothetical protein